MVRIDRFLIQLTDAVFHGVDRVAALLTGRRVSDITTDEVLAMQAQNSVARKSESGNSAAGFVIVDVRSDAETSVSMIPGAITRRQYEQEPAQYRDALVIPYCTVGGRSHLYTRRLIKTGVNARNYRPGIVGWCQAHESLVTPDGQPTTRVHVGHSVYKVPEEYDPVT